MKNSERMGKEIKSLIKEREYCDKNDFEKREYLNTKIKDLMSRYELELNNEMGIK